MRAFIVGILLLLNLILQSTLFGHFEILGVLPNTALLIIVSYAILRGDVEGAIVGFFAGLLQDLFFARYIGFFALCGALTGYVCGKPFKDFFRENYMLPMILVLAAMLANSFVFYVFHFLLQGQTDLLYYVQKIILPETVYTLFLSIPVYRMMYGLNERLEKFTKRRRSIWR